MRSAQARFRRGYTKLSYMIVICVVGFLAYQQGGLDALLNAMRKNAAEDAEFAQNYVQSTKGTLAKAMTKEGLAGEIRQKAAAVVEKQTGAQEGDFVKLMEKYAKDQ